MSDQVEAVKQKVDIVTVIGSRIELKKSGKYFKGLCPFHGERTPSFFVSSELQVFKCFGCGESGDVFSFLQRYEGLSFREVLEDLAQKVGITLESYRPTNHEADTKRMYEILSLAQEYYHFLLLKHPVGEPARRYLEERKVSRGLIEEFYLGWAPDMWTGLLNYLVGKKKYSQEEVEKVGLIIKSDTTIQRHPGTVRYYDRFRGRVMFPLRDFRGRVVGFSGRILNQEAKEAKYINTPETALYHKRELLYGVDLARSVIRKKDKVIVVEGEFDVISSFAAGVRHVVAIKGSALTEDHIRLLMRLTKQVVLCLDADTAGDEAMKRGFELADSMGMDVSVVQVTGGKDVDEIASNDSDFWKQLSQQHISIYEFLINSTFTKHDATTGTGKKQITDQLLPVLDRITNKVEQAHYLGVVSKKLSVSEEVLVTQMQQTHKKKQLGLSPVTQSGEVLAQPTSRLERLEKYVWNVYLQLQGPHLTSIQQDFQQVTWSNPGLQRLAEQLSKFLVTKQSFSLTEFVRVLPGELQGLVQELYLDPVGIGSSNQESLVAELQKAIQELLGLSRKNRLKQVSQRIADLESHGELSDQQQAELLDLQKEVAQLSVLLVA